MATGSVTVNSIPTIVSSGSGVYTYSSATMITGSVTVNAIPTVLTSGSGIYTYASATMVTGSITVSTLPAVSGQISGSGIYTYASAQMVTGSIDINSVNKNLVTSGSGIYTYAAATMVTGSVTVTTLPAVSGIISGSGIYTYASAQMVTGSINVNNSVVNAAGTSTIGAVYITGSGYQATLTLGSGSDNAKNALDVNPIATKTFKSAPIVGVSTANSLLSVVAAVANRHIKVYSVLYNNFSGAAVPTYEAWYSSGAGIVYSALTGPMPFGTNEGYSISVNPPAFLFKTGVTGSTLYLSSSAAATHGGVVSYWDDDAS
jgi:hypothetical protein